MYGNIFGPSSVQLHNLNLVLKQIKKRGPVSRADIARELGCSKSTVTKIIGELAGFDLVREVGKGNPATGRKSTLLGFDSKACFVVAVDLRPDHFGAALVDLSGAVACRVGIAARDSRPEVLLSGAAAAVRELIRKSRVDRRRIEAVGVMVSGITDIARGVVRYSAALGWDEPVELAPILARATGLPVFVENDVNALALAESWIGCGQTCDSLAYIYLDEKVGGAYIEQGYISQGADFAFAEFGKLMLSGDHGPEQLETRLALPNLLRRFGMNGRARPGRGVRTAGFDRFLECEQGMREKALSFLIESLGQVVTTIVAILNPRLIVLHCFTETEGEFIDRLIREAHRLLPKLPERTVQVVPATLHGGMEIIGAAALAISNTRFKFIVQG